MMDHETVRELFSEYLEGDLPEEQAREMEEHLDSCEECRELFEESRDTLSTLRGLGRPEPPPDFEQNLKKRIRTRSRGKFFGETSKPEVVYRVPYELISLILILIALALFYMMTLVASIEAPEPPPEDERQEQPDD